jgi:hypothetical protein
MVERGENLSFAFEPREPVSIQREPSDSRWTAGLEACDGTLESSDVAGRSIQNAWRPSTRSKDPTLRRSVSGSGRGIVSRFSLLNHYRVRYLLAGGVAANLHGSVRATKGVDILVPPDAGNMARILHALSNLPWAVARELDPDEMVSKQITIIGDDPRVDVLTVAWTVTLDRAWPRRRVRRIEGVRVPFLSLNDLKASKRTGAQPTWPILRFLSGSDIEGGLWQDRSYQEPPPWEAEGLSLEVVPLRDLHACAGGHRVPRLQGPRLARRQRQLPL